MFWTTSLLLLLPVVSAQSPLYGQCECPKANSYVLYNDANNFRRRAELGRTYYLRCWILLHLLQCLVFAVPSMHWRHHDNALELNRWASVSHHMSPSVQVQMDFIWATGEP